MLSEFDIRHRPITPAFFHSYGTNLSLMTGETSLMSIPRGWWLVFASKIYFPSVQISLHQRFFVTYEKILHVHLIKYIKKKEMCKTFVLFLSIYLYNYIKECDRYMQADNSSYRWYMYQFDTEIDARLIFRLDCVQSIGRISNRKNILGTWLINSSEICLWKYFNKNADGLI